MLDKALNLQPGQRLDRFQLTELLGQGGVGQVWEVRDSSQRDKSKPYALKVVRYPPAAGDFAIAKLAREGRMLEQIKHENIVEVHDSGIIRDLRVVWILMELLEGRTLRWLMRRGPLSPALVCAYLRQAARGTQQLHLLGAAHRDLKPENMFLTLSARRTLSQLKLLDFGLAKFLYGQDTQEGERHGTPLYMAPEQIEGKKATSALDVYALGLTAYEALLGAHPFDGGGSERDPFLIFHRHLNLMPIPLWELGRPRGISQVIQQAISKRPEDRFPNGGAFAEALWEAWKRDKRTHPELDTACGEPTLEELEADSQRGRSFTRACSSRARGAPKPGRTYRGGSRSRCRSRSGHAERRGPDRAAAVRDARCFRCACGAIHARGGAIRARGGDGIIREDGRTAIVRRGETAQRTRGGGRPMGRKMMPTVSGPGSIHGSSV